MLLTADPIFNVELNSNNVVLLVCIVSAFFSTITSIIMASITSRKEYNNDVRKWILEKRAVFYVEVYKKVEIAMKDPAIVFDNDFFETLIQLKPEVKLFASNGVFDVFGNFYNYVRILRKELRFFYKQNNPYNNIEVYYDDDGIEQYSNLPNEIDMDDFNLQLSTYKDDNSPSVKDIKKYIDGLYKAMRNDLGSNID